MLLRVATLKAIVAGEVSVVFRRWRRPTVRSGGTLVTAVGQLGIEAVDRIALRDITDADARRAGFTEAAAVRAELAGREGDVYRIRLRHAGADPRIALRARADLDAGELEQVQARLARLDRAAANGAWTRRYLGLIAQRPGVRAGDLAVHVGLETKPFKANVRKLKALGLTESLEVGYRLSPRGTVVLKSLAPKK